MPIIPFYFREIYTFLYVSSKPLAVSRNNVPRSYVPTRLRQPSRQFVTLIRLDTFWIRLHTFLDTFACVCPRIACVCLLRSYVCTRLGYVWIRFHHKTVFAFVTLIRSLYVPCTCVYVCPAIPQMQHKRELLPTTFVHVFP